MKDKSDRKIVSPQDVKKDTRSKCGAWAPGKYYNSCCECGDMFIGDKRAVMCADCAYKYQNVGL